MEKNHSLTSYDKISSQKFRLPQLRKKNA